MGNKVRRNGATTRLVDFYIQELFKGDTIEFKDHNTTDHAQHIVRKIVDRLKYEHLIPSVIKSKEYDSKLLETSNSKHLILVVYDHPSSNYMIGELTTKEQLKL